MLFISFCVAFSERKYLSATRSSKMSDNEHPFPVLRDSEILAVKHFPFCIIPQFIKRGKDSGKRSPVIVIE